MDSSHTFWPYLFIPFIPIFHIIMTTNTTLIKPVVLWEIEEWNTEMGPLTLFHFIPLLIALRVEMDTDKKIDTPRTHTDTHTRTHT